MADEPADFLTLHLVDGGAWTRLDRLTDGRVMCALCFGFFHRADLNPVGDGTVEDACRPCGAAKAAAVGWTS